MTRADLEGLRGKLLATTESQVIASKRNRARTDAFGRMLAVLKRVDEAPNAERLQPG